jgi:hypothetical protein
VGIDALFRFVGSIEEAIDLGEDALVGGSVVVRENADAQVDLSKEEQA